MQGIELIVALLLASTVLAGVARAIHVHYAIVLVLGGLAVGLVSGTSAPQVDPHTVGCAYVGRGLRRWHGALIICAYLAFVGMVLASAYSSPVGMSVSAALAAATAIGAAPG